MNSLGGLDMLYSKVRYMAYLGHFLVIAFAISSLSAQEDDRNSTKKIRVQPGELASRVGSAVEWRDDVEQALQEARKSGRPVFWYVPTLKGSFMDRKVEIDRYMLGGPFSHPEIIRLLNTEFIPLRAKAKGANSEKYELLPFKFVEPGFIVLNPDGSLKQSVDRLTTFQSRWLFQLIAGAAGKTGAQFNVTPRLAKQWKSAGRGDWQFEIPAFPADDPDAVEAGLLRGMQAFRNNQPGKATRIFAETSQMQPENPLAWKAAAEAEGIGPFVRGFEVVRELPQRAYEAGRDSAGSAAPVGVYDEEQLCKAGIDFLLGMQNEAGGYVDSDYDFGGTDSLPNVHVAVTALVGMALIEAKQAVPAYRSAAVDQALLGCARFVSDQDHVNRADRDEILWAYAYAARLLARLKRVDATGESVKNFPVESSLQTCVNNLQNIQSKRGGWYHEYENPFVTATALCALYEAQQAGAKVDEAKIRRGVESLASQRGNSGSYPYSSGRRRAARSDTERDISAAAGRMPLCEIALRLWGKSDDSRLQNSIEQSFRFQENLDVALKYDDHTSRLAYGGFFFWYDMRGRSEAISYLQDPEVRQQMENRQREIVMALPEIDGCFVDSHEIGRCYGTAMALLCLSRSATAN